MPENRPDLYMPVETMKRQYLDYLDSKRSEIAEQKEARRYYHGDQWTEKELMALRKRNQPPVTSNRTARKINGIVGLVERLRQDPKAYPRTPMHEKGAELATAVIRFALDANDWNAKSPEVALDGSVDGIGGIELSLEEGDMGDPDVGLSIVEPDTFYYDPRSFRPDFSDARYMGIAKWADIDLAKEMFPEFADEFDQMMQSGGDMTQDSDRERKWLNISAKRVRLVEHWYVKNGEWLWAFFTGPTKLEEGPSPFIDEKGKSFCRFIMYSAFVDHDGDRYGFVRNLKSSQDEINHHKSKAIHIAGSRRLIMEQGAVEDVNKAKSEWAKPDGVVVKNRGFEIDKDDSANDLQGQLVFLQDAKDDIENFGPNPALVGTGVENKSGRAIALLQQAGISELGPYMLAYRGWKIRVYRAIWNIIQAHWQAERWIRVTDDEEASQFIEINKVETDDFGIPRAVNLLNSLDVDIILDESQDTVNLMADAFEAIVNSGVQVPPDILIELAPIQQSVKKRILDKLAEAQAANPLAQLAQQIQLEGDAAKVDETKSKTVLNQAKAMEELSRTDREEFRAVAPATPA